MTQLLAQIQTNRGFRPYRDDQAKTVLTALFLTSMPSSHLPDNVEEIAKTLLKAIIQPGGSVRDQESIEAADKYGLAMVFGRETF